MRMKLARGIKHAKVSLDIAVPKYLTGVAVQATPLSHPELVRFLTRREAAQQLSI
jgi:hypothetical protein